MKLRALFITLLFTNASFARVIESTQYSDILKYSDAQTLIVSDLDNTVMRPVQDIGSDQWGATQIAELKNAGIPEMRAKDFGVAMFAIVQMKTQVQTVEPRTASLLATAHRLGVRTMGLTARPLYLADRTIDQLNTLHVNFYPQANIPVLFEQSRFQNGVVFVGPHQNKGLVLKGLITSGKFPGIHRVVFIDDKAHHTEDVDNALKDLNLDVVSIRYGATDEWVRTLDTTKTNADWEHFQKTGELN